MKLPDPEKVLKLLDALVIDRDRYQFLYDSEKDNKEKVKGKLSTLENKLKEALNIANSEKSDDDFLLYVNKIKGIRNKLMTATRDCNNLVQCINILADSFGLRQDGVKITLEDKIGFIHQEFKYVVDSYWEILNSIDPVLVTNRTLAHSTEAIKVLNEEREGYEVVMDAYELQNNQLYDNFRNMLHSLRAIIQSQEDSSVTLIKISYILEEYKATLDSFDVSNPLSENQICFAFMNPTADGRKQVEEDTPLEIRIDAPDAPSSFSKYLRRAGDFLSRFKLSYSLPYKYLSLGASLTAAVVLSFGVGSDNSNHFLERNKPAKIVTGEVYLESVSSVSEMCFPQVVTSTIAEFKPRSDFFSDFFSNTSLLVEKAWGYNLFQDAIPPKENSPPQLSFEDCPEKISYESRNSVSCRYKVSDDDSLDKCVVKSNATMSDFNFTKEETITAPFEQKKMCAFEVEPNTYCKGGGYPCNLDLQIACYDMEGLQGNVLLKTVIINKAKGPSCGSKYAFGSAKKNNNWSRWSCQAVEEDLEGGCLSQNQYIDQKTAEKHNLRLGCPSETLCCPPE